MPSLSPLPATPVAPALPAPSAARSLLRRLSPGLVERPINAGPGRME